MRPQIAAVLTLMLTACAAKKPAQTPAPGPRPGADAVFEVLEATGKSYVMLGPSSAPPTTRSNPVVIGHGLAIEINDAHPIDPPLSFTLVGTRGACSSTAATMVKISGGTGWVDAVELDGCRGDPAEQRLALMGQVPDARWMDASETMTADGEPIPTSGFFEGSLDGKLVEKTSKFTGLDLSFEQRFRPPNTGPIATRVVAGDKVVDSFFANVDGAFRAGQRWLIVVVSEEGERSVLELRADTLVPRLGKAPRAAPISSEVPETQPKEPTALASKPAEELSGALQALRAPTTKKGGALFLIDSLRRDKDRVVAELVDDSDKRAPLEIAWPAGLAVPFAKGQRIRVQAVNMGRPPQRRFSLLCSAENGQLLLATNAGSVPDWKVARGKSYKQESGVDSSEERFVVSFQHAEASVETKDNWAKVETDQGTYYVYGSSAKVTLKKGKRPPPDFVGSWTDFAIVRAR
ncbi:MAG TPA: hypothetical protein PKA88_01940 [Polyangiaceae bacterium]|nr:hypothetical protein [Polyangiaceae bacterium]